jgi:DNA-binding Xre family transcriptional regulator
MIPVRITVKRVLDERGMNISQFAEAAKISYPTALSWYHGTARRIELQTLSSVCNGLKIELSDVLEYMQTESEEVSSEASSSS